MVLNRLPTPRRTKPLSYTPSRILNDRCLAQFFETASTVEELVALSAAAAVASSSSQHLSPASTVAALRRTGAAPSLLPSPASPATVSPTTPTTLCSASSVKTTPGRLWSRIKRCRSVIAQQMAATEKRIDIVLLDGSTLSFSVKPRMQGRELFDAVASHLRLRHVESFGLAYQVDGDYFHWLDLDKKVLRQDVARVSTLFFRIRFYYESICCLDDLLAVAFYYLSARNLLTSGTLHCAPSTYFQLVSLVLQAGTGDFVDEETTQLLVDKLSLVPPFIKLKVSSSDDIIQTIATQHASLAGCSSGTSLVRFMEIAQKLPVYGVHLYHVKDKSNSPTVLGICSRGILEYAHGADLCGAPTYFYEWEQLENLFHRDCKFTIEFHQCRTLPSTVSLQNGAQSSTRQPRVPATPSGTTGQRATTRSWTTPSELVAQSVWYNAVQQHNFYLSREGNRRSVNPLPTMATIASSIDLDRDVSSRLLLKPVSSAAPTVITSAPTPLEKENSTTVQSQQVEQTPRSSTSSNTVKVPPGVDPESLQRYLELKQRRNVLRETVAMKRQLLRDVCMQEAKLTGELPIEYPLAPGEDRPLLVPTSYTLSTRLLSHSPSTSNANNAKNNSSPNGVQVDTGFAAIVDLESQIELHRQIVNAKLRLAQDKGQPRKIRNQRMKDYQESLNRVTMLEEQLRIAFHQQQTQQQLKLQQPSMRQPNTSVPLFNRRNGAVVPEENGENGAVTVTKESSSPLSSLSSSGIGGGVSTPSVGNGSAGILSKAKSLQDCRRLSDGSNSLGGSALSLHQQSVDALASSGVPDGRAAQLAAALSNANAVPALARVSGSYSTNGVAPGANTVSNGENYDSLYNAFSHSRQTYRSFTAGGEFPGMSTPSSNGYTPSRIHSYDTVLPVGNSVRSANSTTIRGSAAIAKSIDSGFHDVAPAASSSHDFLPQACRPPLSPVLSTPRTAPSTPGSPLRCTCGNNNGATATPKNMQCHRYQVASNCQTAQLASSRGQLYSVSEHATCNDSTTLTSSTMVASPVVTKSAQACVLRKPYKSETSLNRSQYQDQPNQQAVTPTSVRQQPAFVATRAPGYTPFSPATVGSPVSEVACSPMAAVDDGDSPRDGAMPVRVYARSPWTAKAYVSPRRYSGPGINQLQSTQSNSISSWAATDSSSSLMTPRQYNRANTVAVTDFALHSTTSSSSSLSSFAVNSQLATDFSSEMLQWYEEYLPGNHQKQQTQQQQQTGAAPSANQQPTFV